MGSALNAITFLKVFEERNGPVVDAELRTEFVKNVPRTVNSVTAEQQLFVQQEMDYIDYKDDNGWEKLDKDSSIFFKLSKKHNKGESNAWGKVSERNTPSEPCAASEAKRSEVLLLLRSAFSSLHSQTLRKTRIRATTN